MWKWLVESWRVTGKVRHWEMRIKWGWGIRKALKINDRILIFDATADGHKEWFKFGQLEKNEGRVICDEIGKEHGNLNSWSDRVVVFLKLYFLDPNFIILIMITKFIRIKHYTFCTEGISRYVINSRIGGSSKEPLYDVYAGRF